MGKANQSLRDELSVKHIPYWELAKSVGVHESTIIRWMRVPLSPENMARIRIAINEIMVLREGGAGNAL